jgi:RNA polymerase sigma-70 factor (ECF subfamily)
MDWAGWRHSQKVRSFGLLRAASEPARASLVLARPCTPARVAEVYTAHFAFVWRTARRLGIPEQHVDDVAQEVFLVVQRRLADFEGRSELRTWLFGITRNVVRRFRHKASRHLQTELEHVEDVADSQTPSAEAQLAALQRVRLLHALLDELDDGDREVFILSELEEMTGPEIARALDLHLSNVYARIRRARKAFDQALQRYRAGQGRLR